MIELPWPPKELSPNARVHYMAKAKHTKAYREQAYWLTRASVERGIHPSPRLKIVFHPPDRRRRDLDGMLSSIKAGLDGIADAMAVNDSEFELNLSRAEPIKGGRVMVSLI